jgi:hypothetical protein
MRIASTTHKKPLSFHHGRWPHHQGKRPRATHLWRCTLVPCSVGFKMLHISDFPAQMWDYPAPVSVFPPQVLEIENLFSVVPTQVFDFERLFSEKQVRNNSEPAFQAPKPLGERSRARAAEEAWRSITRLAGPGLAAGDYGPCTLTLHIDPAHWARVAVRSEDRRTLVAPPLARINVQ